MVEIGLPPYLARSEIIDSDHPKVAEQARRLAAGPKGDFALVRRCFEWVSNEIPHSRDCAANTVPCTASEVLEAGHGLCFAKSHLLAALLRANGIAAGFDYQRLGSPGEGYALHGLNRVYLAEASRWLTLDSRGQANAPIRLAEAGDYRLFIAAGPGEVDYGLNLPEPERAVVRFLREAGSFESAMDNLPSTISMG
jgi:transglutaminase-like putative cysteine protease